MEVSPSNLITSDATKNHISAVSALIGDPSKFGRVAEDGTVYVRTSIGERAVGSYPGKTSEEALEYFVRKFASVASEVALLADRIKSGSIIPSDAHEAVGKLRIQIAGLNGVGDLETLAASVEQIPALISEHESAYHERKAVEAAVREAKKAAALLEKTKIVEAAEALVESTAWKKTSETLKELLAQWKAAPRLDKATDTELWKRFSSARNKFDKRRRTHFSNLDSLHKEVAAKKEELVKTAQSLMNSKEWLTTANKYKDLMAAWKSTGRGKPSSDAKLWAAFKTAQDHFFTAKNADMEKRNESMAANLAKREELLPKFEALIPVTDISSARKQFRSLMEQWTRIGMTDRKKRAEMDARISKVERAIKELVEEHNRRTDPTAIAHANSVVKGLMDAIASYEEQAAKAEASGNSAKAMVAREAAAARRAWLAEAEKGLADFKQN